MTKQPSPAELAAMNGQMRALMLATAPRMRKNVITVTAQSSQTSRMKLFNVGVLTKLQLLVSILVTIGTATATPSGKAPWNAIARVRLTDYDGTDRVNVSGFQLFVMNCVRWSQYYGFNNDSATAVFTNPSIPTAVGNGTVSFFIDVPLAFDIDNKVVQLQDLRGAIIGQTAVGEMYLSIDWLTSYYANADVESLYAGGGTTTVVANGANNISCTMWQEYLLPQAVGNNGAIPWPSVDLQTVYELTGNVRSSDNLAAAAEKLISYPNVRSVIGAYINFVAGGVLAVTVTGLRIIANGNNILVDHTYNSQLFYQRNYLNGDIAQGVFFRLHREKPVETQLLGNMQIGFTPSAVGATPYLELGFESFYTRGAGLPGIGQAQ